MTAAGSTPSRRRDESSPTSQARTAYGLTTARRCADSSECVSPMPSCHASCSRSAPRRVGGRLTVTRQTGRLHQGPGGHLRRAGCLVVHARAQATEHATANVRALEFAAPIAAVHERMTMAFVHKRRMRRIAPLLGV